MIPDVSVPPFSVPLARRGFLTLAGAAALALAGCGTASIGDSGTAASIGRAHLGPIRAAAGLPALSSDPALERAALEQARYMAGSARMEHTTRFGRDFASRVAGNGIEGAAAENIAHGRFGPDELFSRWMNSPAHRRNMLDPRFSRFGLAYAYEDNGSGRRYWALILGR